MTLAALPGAAGAGSVRLPAGTPMGFIQDSRGERGRTNNAANDRIVAWKSGGFHAWLSRLSGGRVILDPRWVSARGGYTCRQGRDILAPRMVACGIPRAVLIWLGTNDPFTDPAAMAADIAAIRDMLLAERITPILATEVPREGERPGSPRFAGRLAFNRHLLAMANGRVGVIDMVPGLTRPDGSALPDIYLADNPPANVHFNHKGNYLAGRIMAEWIMAHVAAPDRAALGGGADLAAIPAGTAGYRLSGPLRAAVSRPAPGRIEIAFSGGGGNATLVTPAFGGLVAGGYYVAEWDAMLSDPAGIEAIEFSLTGPDGAIVSEGMLSTGGRHNSNMLAAGAAPLPEGFRALLRTPILRAATNGAGTVRVTVSASSGGGAVGGRLSLIGAPRLLRIPDARYRAIDDGRAQRHWQLLVPRRASGGGTDLALAQVTLQYRDGPDLADSTLNQNGTTPALAGAPPIALLDDDPATAYRCAAGSLAAGPVVMDVNCDIPIRVSAIGIRAIATPDWRSVNPVALHIRTDPTMTGTYADAAPPVSGLALARGGLWRVPVRP